MRNGKRFWAQCTALLLLLATFATPKIQFSQKIYDVVAVLDITGSMNATDQFLGGESVSRITMEKRALHALLAALPCGSKLGVAIFVEERPFLLFEPMDVCGNFAPLDQAIAGIDWRMGWDSESHIAAGLHAAIITARDAGADLLFMTDGQEVPPLAWSAPINFAAIRGAVGGAVIGVGGHEFVKIPKFDKTGHQIGVWKPGEVPSETGGFFKGHEYLTALDQPHLRALASDAGLHYARLSTPNDLLAALESAAIPRRRQSPVDIRFAPASAALLILGSMFFFEKRRSPPCGNQKTFASSGALWP
jgi:mxaL protein